MVKICDVKQRLNQSLLYVGLMPPSVGSLEPQTATGCSREYLYVLRRLPGRGLTFPIATVRYGPLKVTAYKYSLEHPGSGSASKLPTLGGIKRTKGSDFSLCLTSQIFTTLSGASWLVGYAFSIHTVDMTVDGYRR